MPHLFRTTDSKLWKPNTRILLTLANGTTVEGHWAGSAKEEKLSWWLGMPGSELTQTEEISAVAIKADDNGEIIWAEAPTEARLLFVLLATEPGKNYRLAKNGHNRLHSGTDCLLPPRTFCVVRNAPAQWKYHTNPASKSAATARSKSTGAILSFLRP